MAADEGLQHSLRGTLGSPDGQGAIAPDDQAQGLAARAEDQLEGEIIDTQTGQRDPFSCVTAAPFLTAPHDERAVGASHAGDEVAWSGRALDRLTEAEAFGEVLTIPTACWASRAAGAPR